MFITVKVNQNDVSGPVERDAGSADLSKSLCVTGLACAPEFCDYPMFLDEVGGVHTDRYA